MSNPLVMMAKSPYAGDKLVEKGVKDDRPFFSKNALNFACVQ